MLRDRFTRRNAAFSAILVNTNLRRANVYRVGNNNV